MNKQQAYHLKLTIKDIQPAIWRSVVVLPDMTFAELSDVITGLMRWSDYYHLHMFTIPGTKGKRPVQIVMDNNDPVNKSADIVIEDKVKLAQYLSEVGQAIEYCYDFGDDWRINVELMDIIDRDEYERYPTCTGGERASPPEDCGGVYGYERLLEIVNDPKHEEYEDMMEWLGLVPEEGDTYDPEEFSLNPGGTKKNAAKSG